MEGIESLRQDQERFEFRKRDVERKRRCSLHSLSLSLSLSLGRRSLREGGQWVNTGKVEGPPGAWGHSQSMPLRCGRTVVARGGVQAFGGWAGIQPRGRPRDMLLYPPGNMLFGAPGVYPYTPRRCGGVCIMRDPKSILSAPCGGPCGGPAEPLLTVRPRARRGRPGAGFSGLRPSPERPRHSPAHFFSRGSVHGRRCTFDAVRHWALLARPSLVRLMYVRFDGSR